MSISSTDMFRLSTRHKTAEEIAIGLIFGDVQTYIKARAEDGWLDATYEVPMIHPGSPAFNYKAVCRGIKAKLESCDFNVQEKEEGILQIDWDIQRDNPNSNGNEEDVKIIYAPPKSDSDSEVEFY